MNEHTTFYEKMGITPLINASETYTNLGGSLMDPRTVEAMNEAGEHFVDYHELLKKVNEKAAELTHNESAFVTTGAAGGLILSAAAAMCGPDEKRLDQLPHVENFQKNEILMFDGKFREIIPYWGLTGLTGAKIVAVEPTVDAMVNAVNEKTAAVFLFPATLYEEGIPTCEEVIPALKKTGVTIVVDAAAQLPPSSNLWYYTKKLGADLCVFSGGKHIRGPQCTGLVVGREDLTEACRMAASPNARIGRAFKTGKEELAGFITALEIFVTKKDEDEFMRQEAILQNLQRNLMRGASELKMEFRNEGRLGTYQPLLLVTLPEGKTAEACNKYTRSLSQPIDIGVYQPEFGMPEDVIFLNAYNLKPGEEDQVADGILGYLKA